MHSAVRYLHRGAPRGLPLSSAVFYSGLSPPAPLSGGRCGGASSIFELPFGLPRAFTTGPTGGPQERPMASFGYRDVTREEKEKLVNDLFTSVAEKYDLMNDLMSFGLHRIWKDNFTQLVNFPPLRARKTPGEDSQGTPARDSTPAPNATAAESPAERGPHEDSKNAGAFTVLDLAGGTGDIAFRLIDRALEQLTHFEQQNQGQQHGLVCSGVEITVCDINEQMLQVGMQRAVERGLPASPLVDTMSSGSSSSNSSRIVLPRSTDFGHVGPVGVRWVRGSGECLPFASSSFDLLTIAFGLRNFTNVEKGLQEALRVLKRGGRLLCLEFSPVDTPVIKPLYDLFSFTALPVLGQFVAGDRGAYQYLAESIRRFPAAEVLGRMLQQQGFVHVSYSTMSCGIVAIHSAHKP